MSRVHSPKSPTGQFAPAGTCGFRGCDAPAKYEATYKNWPVGLRTGACEEHAPSLRHHPQLAYIRTWRTAS